MQVFKQFHKILLDIFNHMLPTIYTVKSLEPVLNCTEKSLWNDFFLNSPNAPTLFL